MRAVAVLLVGTFMASMDVAIVNVAAPAIQDDLGASDSELQLVVSGYTLAYASLLVTGARLGDDRGHDRLFFAGLVGFTAASLLCGLAGSAELLIVARVLQGAAAAAMAPQVVTVIQLQFDGAERARALALFATVISTAVVAGQIVGGVLVSADIAGSGWRPIFLVNVPVGLALLVFGRRVVPHTRIAAPARLDLAGAVGLGVTVLLVMVPLVFGHEEGWPWWTWALLVAALPAGVALRAHLRRRPDPLFDLTLLRRAPVGLGLLCILAQMLAYGGFLLTCTLYLQQGLDYSAVRSAAVLVPYALVFGAASLAAARLSGRASATTATAGLAVMAAGYGALALWVAAGERPGVAMAVLLAVTGAGFGAGYSPVITRIAAAVAPERARDASGMYTTVNQLGYALGVATVGSLFLGVTASTEDAFALAAGLCAAVGLAAAALAAALTRAEARLPAR